MSHPALSACLLAVVFMLKLTHPVPADLGLAAVVGVVLTLALRRRLPPGPRGSHRSLPARLAGLPVFLVAVVADVARGTWDVMLRVLHVRPVEHSGLVLVPVGDRTPEGVAVSALVMTLSPGTVFVELDEEREAMLVHVIDASDPDAVREHLQAFYDRRQKRVFP